MSGNILLVEKSLFEPIVIINIVLSSISILWSMFIIFIYWFFKDIRSFSFELVIWLIISTLIDSLSTFLILTPNIQFNSNTCIIQGFIQITSDNSILIWACLIAFTAHLAVKDYYRLEHNSNYYRIIYLILSFGLPLLVSIIVFSLDGIGPSGAWCWLHTETVEEEKQKLIRPLIFFFISFMWIMVFVTTYFIFRVVNTLQKGKWGLIRREKELIDDYSVKLKLYPIAMVICVIPATVNRLFLVITMEENIILFYIQAIFDGLQGLIYSSIFGLSPAVKESIKELFRIIFRLHSPSFLSEQIMEEENKDSFISRTSMNHTKYKLYDI